MVSATPGDTGDTREKQTLSFFPPPVAVPQPPGVAAAVSAAAAAATPPPRLPQFTCPTPAQRLLPPMSLATPTTLPLLRPHAVAAAAEVVDRDGDTAATTGPFPFATTRDGEAGGQQPEAEDKEEEEEEEEEELCAFWESRRCGGGCPWSGCFAAAPPVRSFGSLPLSPETLPPVLFLLRHSTRADPPSPYAASPPPPACEHLKRLAMVPSLAALPVPLPLLLPPLPPPPLVFRC